MTEMCGGLQREHVDESVVEELHAGVGAIDHDAGGQVLQHLRMGGDVAGELGLGLLEARHVEGVAGEAAVRERLLREVEQPAIAAHDHVLALRLRRLEIAGAIRQRLGGAADLDAAGDRVLRRAVGGAGEGGVAVGEGQIGVPHPDGHG